MKSLFTSLLVFGTMVSATANTVMAATSATSTAATATAPASQKPAAPAAPTAPQPSFADLQAKSIRGLSESYNYHVQWKNCILAPTMDPKTCGAVKARALQELSQNIDSENVMIECYKTSKSMETLRACTTDRMTKMFRTNMQKNPVHQ